MKKQYTSLDEVIEKVAHCREVFDTTNDNGLLFILKDLQELREYYGHLEEENEEVKDKLDEDCEECGERENSIRELESEVDNWETNYNYLRDSVKDFLTNSKHLRSQYYIDLKETFKELEEEED